VSRENVEIVRRMMEAWVGGSPETALGYMAADVEYDVTVRPDGKVWHGHEGVSRAVIEWVGAWSEWSIELERYLDVGDDRVAFLWQERGTAKGSGVAMSLKGISVVTLRDGVVVSMVAHVDRERVLADLGLEYASSQQHVESVRRLEAAYTAYCRRDWDAFFAEVDPGYEWDVVEESVPVRGREAVIEYFERWLGAWEDFDVEIIEMEITRDGRRAFVAVRTSGRNAMSTVPIEGRFFHVIELRDGRPVRGKEYSDRGEARAAAGLSAKA
jgi:ketosteroid isomerase-like protein